MKAPSCTQMTVLAFFLLVCLQDDVYCNFLAGEIQGYTFLNFLSKKVVRGNAVQIFPNFPAKSLSIYRMNYFFTPL